MPKVAILLPVFNGELYLREAIESVLSQTYTDFEFLIADDASIDSSKGIINDFAKRDARIKAWTNSRNKGLFGNYNECLQRAEAEYIKPFAQDDLLDPTMLELMVPLLDKDPELALVSCARRCVDEQGRERKILREFKENTKLTFDQVLKDNLLNLKNGIGEPTTVLFRKNYAGAGFDESFYHLGDIEYWFRVIERGKYLYFDQVLCSFRQHDDSTTSKNSKGLRFALDMVHLGRKYRTFLEQIGLTEENYSWLVARATATHVKFLSRHKGASLKDLLSVEHETPESAMRDLAGFKELLFYSLLIAGETIEENYALKQEWEAERNRLEDEIAKLMKSRSWQITKPLRGATKALRS